MIENNLITKNARKTIATIHLDAICHNYKLANDLTPNSKNIAVIKADAYGHGSIEVAKALESLVPAFAVALFDEAVTLREAGITKPLLILEGIYHSNNLIYAAENNIWTMVVNQKQAELIEQTPLHIPIKIWLKFDTGMRRLGMNAEHIRETYNRLQLCNWVDNKMVLTSHLASAAEQQLDFTDDQITKIQLLASELNLNSSLANSAGIIAFPKSRLDWNRPGIMLYGISPFETPQLNAASLEPAMTFSSTVIDIHQLQKGDCCGYGGTWIAPNAMQIATIAVGYADGYPRHAANGTPLQIAGQQAFLVGRVSMDMITADISHCKDVQLGDSVELWGKNVDIATVASQAETIGYDLVTGVSQRVPRLYTTDLID